MLCTYIFANVHALFCIPFNCLHLNLNVITPIYPYLTISNISLQALTSDFSCVYFLYYEFIFVINYQATQMYIKSTELQ